MPAVPYNCSSAEIEHHLNITAREGDLNAVGSQLKAGNDVALSASRDITLQSAQNTQLLEGKNDSHGGTVGVGIGVGSGGWGISVSASANKGKGSESGNGTTHSETTVDAGNRLTLNSGRDTTLTGAQVSGDKVVMDVGRNLTLTSEQDSDRYDSKQQNASAGGSFTFGSMSGSASVNLSKDKMHSNYDSVVEQTGIFAGKGGYDITVGEHTQLNGAVIGSTATADKNRLDTGTLGWGDIDNRADFKTEHQSVGFSSGGSIGSQFAGNMANGLLTGGNNEGHDSSTTHAAVSDGTLIVRNPGQQTQDTATLSHDVEHANQTLSPIFDKEKEQQRLQQTQLIGEIGNQVADIARTQGEINGLEKAKAALGPLKENATEKERTAYTDALRNSDVYKAEMAKYGTGSAVQQGLQAATAAIQGLSGGDIAKAIAGGAAPYIAEVIKQTAPDEASRIMAHAAVAGVIAAVQGNSSAAGAAGAATTALMGEAIKKTLYGDIPVNQLSEDQKQTLVTLGTLAAGLAGGLASDSSASAMAGAQAGQNEISNNMASIGMLQQMMAQETLNAAAMAEAGKGTANDQAALALTKKVKEGLSASCLANDVCVLMAVVAAQSQQHADSSGSRTETLPVHDDLTGGKLVNPIQDENQGTSLITPDQSDDQRGSNTGNTEGTPDTGGNTTVTPILDGPNKDDLAYLATGDKPANLSPEGSARAGAFNEAKRQSGVPVSQSPSKVSPNVDRRGNIQPGYIYEFDVPKPGGGTQKVYIRDDAGGHFYEDDASQNRGPHFNDEQGNHYDY